MTDEKIIQGIQIWIRARKLEAAHLENKAMFEAMQVLDTDLEQALSKDQYPWDLIVEGFQRRAAKDD